MPAYEGNVPCTSADLVVGTYNVGIRHKCLNNGDTPLEWSDLGSTTGGVTITQSNEYTEVFNDQSLYLQAKFRTSEKVMVALTMQSVTLDRLRAAFASKNNVTADANGNNSLVVGGQQTCNFPEEWELVIVGPGPGCGCRVFEFGRAVFTPDSVEYVITRDNPVQLAIEIECLASCPDGKIMTITDYVDCATDDTGMPVWDSTVDANTGLNTIQDYIADGDYCTS